MPLFSKNKLAQSILQNCIDYQIKDIVISPGSRNAPLTIDFVNHPDMNAMSIVDERCAGFFALGLAQQQQRPTALVCTSGSALLNYYPAVAEAFYSKISLIIISADRPKHLIDIGDGQTIRQENVFDNHILFNANLCSSDGIDAHHKNENLIKQAIQIAIDKKGPVHINVPFEEPLYETIDNIVVQNIPEVVGDKTSISTDYFSDQEFQKHFQTWNSSLKKMILIGSNFPDKILQSQLDKIALDDTVIVLTETTSNIFNNIFINSIDKVIFSLKDEEFQKMKPDLLLTVGGMIVSKKIKQFLRSYQPKHHWHIDTHRAFDTFHSLSHHFKITPQLFFNYFFKFNVDIKRNISIEESGSFQNQWLRLKNKRKLEHKKYLKGVEFSDLKVFESVIDQLPKKINLQLANSSIIRYSQLFDVDPSNHVFCNRGTSGIEGSTSTAIGAAYKKQEKTVFITGDMSFLYDSNALWNNYIRNDFRIILINNSGGGIFRFIPGPKSTNALEYFETPHRLNASLLCQMYGFDYVSAKETKEVKRAFKTFYNESDKPKLLEIFTPQTKNDLVLKEYFKYLSMIN